MSYWKKNIFEKFVSQDDGWCMCWCRFDTRPHRWGGFHTGPYGVGGLHAGPYGRGGLYARPTEPARTEGTRNKAIAENLARVLL